MITVGVIDDGLEYDEGLTIQDSIYITSDLLVQHVSAKKIKSLHGIICAKIIQKYYDQVRFCSIKILEDRMKTTKRQLIKAIEWCIEHDIKVINMSLGTIEYQDFAQIQAIIDQAYARNVVIVAACHNRNVFTYPASCKNVIGVKADRDLREGEFTFEFHPLDGIEITACSSHDILGEPKKTCICNSFAAPMITAKVCEIMVNHPQYTLDDIKNKLYEESVSFPSNCLERREDDPCVLQHAYDVYSERKEIEVPIIMMFSSDTKRLTKLMECMEQHFRKEGYYAVAAYTEETSMYSKLRCLPINESDGKNEITDKIEKLNRIYDFGLLIIGSGDRKNRQFLMDNIDCDIQVMLSSSNKEESTLQYEIDEGTKKECFRSDMYDDQLAETLFYKLIGVLT